MEHLDENVLVDFARGALGRAGRDAVEQHVDRCVTCRQLVVVLARGPALRDPDATLDAGADPDVPLQHGETLGRFAVLEEIGSGMSGIVYAAYDSQLERKVALKVLRQDLAEARDRVLREARALAKLSDPGVVAVFDAGTLDDRVFLAMELVDGETLRAWLAAERRPWRAIRNVMIAAGRGLAAAHAAGLVHRDIKPDNILVGRDGRVRVGDFGLAAAGAATSRGLVGTPAYMAHEQLVGGLADARSDQFSFAVVLYEACYGKRPFTGTTIAALAAAIEHGPSLDGQVVPRHVRALLARALSADAEERFPSMDALLRELARDPDRGRRRVIGLAGAGAAIAIAAAILGASAADDDACSGGTAQLARVWGATQRADIERAFAATNRPHLGTTVAGALAQLDTYGKKWRDQHASTCHAHRRGEISEASLDRRMTCLDRRRDALRAIIDVFRKADGSVVDRALEAAGKLPRIETCETESIVKIDPIVAAQLADLRALADAGKYNEAHERVASTVAAARATLQDATIAEARLLEGELEHRLGRTANARTALLDAVRRAGDGQDDATLARASVAVLAVQVAEARHADADSTAVLAAVLAKRHGLDVEFAMAMGDLRTSQGRYAEAREHYRRALAADATPLAAITSRSHLGNALAEHGFYTEARGELASAYASAVAHLGASHPTTARSALLLGDVVARLGDYNAGRRLQDDALATLEKNLGAQHPAIADALDSIGVAEADRGESKRARELFERALSIRQGIARPDHPAIAASLDLIAGVLGDEGNLEGAREKHERALELRREALADDHADVVASYANLARIAYYEARYDEAKQLYDDALKRARAGGHDLLASTILANRATLLLDTNDRAGARAGFLEALATVEKTLGAGHPDAATIRSTLASALDEPAQRREQLELALEIRVRAYGEDHADVARSHHELAAFLLELGDLDAGTAHAQRAVEILDRSLGPDHVAASVARLGLANARKRAGALEAADRDAHRALAALEKALGVDHPNVAGALAIAGSIDRLRGLTSAARERLERARTIYATLGTDPERLADVERELAKLRGR